MNFLEFFFLLCFAFAQYGLFQARNYISGSVLNKNNDPLIGGNINLKGTFQCHYMLFHQQLR
ncbi:MAG: hypothetical protein CBE24_03015 [bacterium TMED264]|nr:MAG: hypothetical protein CBE24_03015 [bacterium TMED264]|tara:strand:+ start:2457 stop:2642 length:186 start_codon:yes stop_codon:yes gene_type:complete